MTTLQHKSIPVVCRMPKARSLTRLLMAIGVMVQGEPKREDVERAHRIFRGAKGQSVEVNNLWNEIKRFICPVCDDVKLRQKSGTCSVICGMDSRAVSRRLLAVSLMLCISVANAQRGTLSAVSRQPSASPFALVAPPPVKQPMFQWQNPAGASNVTVSWSLMRDHWTNGTRNIGFSNSFPRTNGWHYVVTARVNDRESTPALWPSNRFAQYWLKDLGTNFQGVRMITNEFLLSTFVNNPYDGQHAWQIEDRTVKFE